MSSGRGRPLSRFWPDDEEMAKKDDDLHLHSKHGAQWRAAPPRPRFIARLGLYACVAMLCFVALYELATLTSGGASVRETYKKWEQNPYDPTRRDTPRGVQKPLQGSRGSEDGDNEEARTYSGPIKFVELAKSLHAITKTGGSMYKNRNVLFAAASLKSAAVLLPMACQMAGERNNYVHFALVGTSDISIGDLLDINGIDEDCKLLMHDARPDHATTSTETRMMLASARALYHINTYMHPQAVIIDATEREDEAFVSGFQDQIRGTGASLIELPDRANVRFSWLTKLDASALAAWNKVHFDILIHAPTAGSGNLKRLLRSLARADFGAGFIPHLTVELPSIIDQSLESLLARFNWPPWSYENTGQSQAFSVRHRIPRKKLDEEESSARFLESFWPRDPANSHVLVLSPHTEVTPQFFHYVKYVILHNLYSTEASTLKMREKIMGISLQHPKSLLDTKTPLHVPEKGKAGDVASPFLWQAPNSEAVLYLGDKWVELHGYVSQMLDKRATSATTSTLLTSKEVSMSYPAWLEYVLQLSRIRGYFTLYPSQETASAITGVHSDLRDDPEEYSDKTDPEDKPEPGEEDHSSEIFDSGSQIDMLATLPGGGTLPSLDDLSLMTWDGKPALLAELDKSATEYATQFRREVGGCSTTNSKLIQADKYARDLFCTTKDTKGTQDDKDTKAKAAE